MSRNSSFMAAFGQFVAAMESSGGDGDSGSTFPRSDAEDFGRGAQFIPGKVTDARRSGQKVTFITNCSPNCWYWQMPNNSRIYHFDQDTYLAIGKVNNRKESGKDAFGAINFEDGAGPCPECGNVHTGGGTVTS